MKKPLRILAAFCVLLTGTFSACSTPTSSETGGIDCPNCSTKTSSASGEKRLSSSLAESSSSAEPELLLSWIDVGDFSILQTEVMQSDYRRLMGTLPSQMTNAVGDSFPVANVSFYDAVLFANELSKFLGLDSAYSYTARGSGNRLSGLRLNADVKAVRLPSETEWKLAARAGTTGTYYWGADVAADYAVYNNLYASYQKVSQKKPNAWNLYDMAGNVAEWTSDTTLCGGDWTSVAKELAIKESKKKTPEFASNESGIRVILSGE